ncbi:MAG: hypothetical protein GY866_32655 [Proteobacteria bacterium]|nr:hypothetical protein [Pseudomonadota bacterium]
MKTTKETVFLLSAFPYRDSDLVANFLSPSNGKLSAVIHRGRKIGKTSSFTFQPGDHLEIEYGTWENRDFIKILNTSALRLLKLDAFPYDRFLFHSYLLELIVRISRPGNPAQELVDILAVNNRLEWSGEQKTKFMAWSFWRIVGHGGYGLDYHICAKCQNRTWQTDPQQNSVFRKETYQLHHEGGRLVCGICEPAMKKGRILSPAMIKVLWLFDAISDFDRIQQRIPEDTLKPLISILNDYLLHSFEISPKSLELFLSTLK